MTNGKLIDYGKDIIRYKGNAVTLLSFLVTIKKEGYLVSLMSDVKNGDYTLIPTGSQNHILFVRSQEQEIEFVYTSPKGREQNSGLIEKINSFLNQEVEVIQK